jgi:PncC family amidohydrolase
MMDESNDLLTKISKMLFTKQLTIATAESCTGGLIGHLLTNIPGSSRYFECGIISYSNQAKMQLLDVPEDLLDIHGAVSEPVAKAMAEGIRKKAKVDIGISSTGIAGPTGGTKKKPVGLVYIGLSTKDQTQVNKFIFSNNRLGNKHETARHAFFMLKDYLEKH